MVPDEDRGVRLPRQRGLGGLDAPRLCSKGRMGARNHKLGVRPRGTDQGGPPHCLSWPLFTGTPMSMCTTSPPAGEMGWPSTPLYINTGEKTGVRELVRVTGWVDDPWAQTHIDKAVR